MKRWFVFDASTAHAAHQAGPNNEVSQHTSVADVLNDEVQSNRPVVLVVPTGGDQATVARITPPERQSS